MIFNTISGLSIMVIVLEEKHDSFIIGLPARLVKYQNNTLGAEPYLPTPTARFFKNTLLNIIDLVNEFELPYLNYVIDNSEMLDLPEEEVDIIKARVEEIQHEGEEGENVLELPEHVDFIFPEEDKKVH